MKRSNSDGMGAPPLKRSNSSMSTASIALDDDDNNDQFYHLKSQNKSLITELNKKKGKHSHSFIHSLFVLPALVWAGII